MTVNRKAPVEPVLEMDDIQGIAVPGFLKPHQTLIALRLPAGPAMAAAKAFLGKLADSISTGAETLADRRLRREQARAQGVRHVRREGRVLVGLGCSAPGLDALTPGASDIASPAFHIGLAGRSALLGDPTNKDAEGHPNNWLVGGPDNAPDLLVVLAGDHRDMVDQRAAALLAEIAQAGLTVLYQEKGDVRSDEWDGMNMRGHEHFGFDDGVSQPGIRGRASPRDDDYITERYLPPAIGRQASLYGLPGQDLIWPGEVVIGYPGSSPDPLLPGQVREPMPDWTRNGSFLVFRRLRQDVGLFWRTMRETAAELARHPGFEGMTDEKLAARVVGRWMSGAPVSRAPDADDVELGKERRANNQFRYDSDTPKLPVEGFDDNFPQAKADPAGITCPWAAHIRKVNVRDSGSDMGGSDATYTRRVLRIGVPFGAPLADRYATLADDPHNGNRGLLFLSVQVSIEDQFEFLQTRWMNDPTRPKTPAGHDLLVGQNPAAGEGRARGCVMFGSGLQQAGVSTKAEWIVPTGGGYFFLPSLSAIRTVLAQ
ncbi:Dyp-type peroxidase [Massilia horti]|uniref:Dyp-type peroxidase n=1 Tax=Massilia horti TaxID=2562153 RepID=A0A4Y9T330_9BURK|nr:Dyp-type peroxidase [Massilia horti]TFW31347.1 Dyp-type peroxidase [Massilia horti]